MMKILAGIVIYNADLHRLSENIGAILPQVDGLLLVDNGSDNDGFMRLAAQDKVSVIRHQANMGIATALNTIMQFASDEGYDWVVTLDHDSVAQPNLVEAYRQAVPLDDKIGIVCCKITDRNFTLKCEAEAPQVDGYVDECITSASMVRVAAWQQVGGFDDAMFIDSVDFDFCRTLRANGWKIYRTYKTELVHELGRSRIVKLFGKEYISLNHTPFRYYYIIRNSIYMGRKHHELGKGIKKVLRTFAIVALYEKNRPAKLRRMCSGLWHGFAMQVNERTSEQ